jgi:hypothetical protein
MPLTLSCLFYALRFIYTIDSLSAFSQHQHDHQTNSAARDLNAGLYGSLILLLPTGITPRAG